MSQSGILADNTSPSGDVETLTADDTNVASPVANNINIFGLNGITTTAAGDTIFVNGINAEAGATEPATQKGVAGYYDGHFTVTTGFVTLLNDTGGAAIQGILTDDGVPAVVADASGDISFVGGEGIDVTGQGPGNIVTIAGEDATAGVNVGASNKGIAGYNSAHFDVTAGFVSLKSASGGAPIQGIVTDDGVPAVVADVNGNVTFVGSNGVAVIGQGPGSQVTIALENTQEFTLTTNDATPQALATIDAGTTAGVYSLDILIAAYAPPPVSAGGAYSMWGGIRTTGAAATLTGVADIAENEEAALIASDVSLQVSGNNIIVQVTGVAATTIRWKALVKYTLVI